MLPGVFPGPAVCWKLLKNDLHILSLTEMMKFHTEETAQQFRVPVALTQGI